MRCYLHKVQMAKLLLEDRSQNGDYSRGGGDRLRAAGDVLCGDCGGGLRRGPLCKNASPNRALKILSIIVRI